MRCLREVLDFRYQLNSHNIDTTYLALKLCLSCQAEIIQFFLERGTEVEMKGKILGFDICTSDKCFLCQN